MPVKTNNMKSSIRISQLQVYSCLRFMVAVQTAQQPQLPTIHQPQLLPHRQGNRASRIMNQPRILCRSPLAAKTSTLVAAVKAADLVDALSNAGRFTVFAPTNDAFSKLPAGTVDNLLKPENKDQLADILQYHVSVGGIKDMLQDGQNQVR